MRAGRLRLLIAAAVAAVGVAVVTTAIATGGGNVRGKLTGYQEVPTTISTTGNGTFRAHRTASGIDWRLTYSGLEEDATQAHIHFGNQSVAGPISVWLCSNLDPPGNTPPGTDPCPLRSGTVTGTITPSDVLGPLAQGIEPGALDEIWEAMRKRAAYANVHSKKWPAGEIRGNLRRGRAN